MSFVFGQQLDRLSISQSKFATCTILGRSLVIFAHFALIHRLFNREYFLIHTLVPDIAGIFISFPCLRIFLLFISGLSCLSVCLAR